MNEQKVKLTIEHTDGSGVTERFGTMIAINSMTDVDFSYLEAIVIMEDGRLDTFDLHQITILSPEWPEVPTR